MIEIEETRLKKFRPKENDIKLRENRVAHTRVLTCRHAHLELMQASLYLAIVALSVISRMARWRIENDHTLTTFPSMSSVCG
jgi:hypothetical protein